MSHNADLEHQVADDEDSRSVSVVSFGPGSDPVQQRDFRPQYIAFSNDEVVVELDNSKPADHPSIPRPDRMRQRSQGGQLTLEPIEPQESELEEIEQEEVEENLSTPSPLTELPFA